MFRDFLVWMEFWRRGMCYRKRSMATAASDTTSLAQAIIRDVDDNPVELGSLWADRPVVLVFIRHFG
jgi:hypothetical protein